MQSFDPTREEIPTDLVFMDDSGDVWMHSAGLWRYLTDEGLTLEDGRDELPAEYAPYQQVSEATARTLRAAFAR